MDHFGCHVFERATKSVPLLVDFSLDAPSKITNFNDVSFLDQNVLRLDVAMYQTLLMHVVDAGTDLDEEVEGRVFAQESLLPDQIEQVTLGGVLER